LRRIVIRREGLVTDQRVNADEAHLTALNASSAVADAADQHTLLDFGLMTSKVEEPASSLPLTQRGIERLEPFESSREAIRNCLVVNVVDVVEILGDEKFLL
jgi:hypothetical protein